jgi:F-type H+-transporting ATPase subunit b
MNLNATLLGQMLTFLIFVGITMKWIWPLFKKVLDERTRKISEGLIAAEQGQRDLEQAEREMKKIISDAKVEAASILDRANKQARDIVEDAKGLAREESDRMLSHAKSEIDQEIKSAREVLRQQVAGLAVAGAEKILARHITANDADKFVNDLVAGL